MGSSDKLCHRDLWAIKGVFLKKLYTSHQVLKIIGFLPKYMNLFYCVVCLSIRFLKIFVLQLRIWSEKDSGPSRYIFTF